MSNTTDEYFFLSRDNDGHWYIVPETLRQKWYDWCDLPSDDEEAWEPPDGTQPIYGPGAVVFSRYKKLSD